MKKFYKSSLCFTFWISFMLLVFSSNYVEAKPRKPEIDRLVICYAHPLVVPEPPTYKGDIIQRSDNQILLENEKHIENVSAFMNEALKNKEKSKGIAFSLSLRIDFIYSDKKKERSVLFVDKKGNFEYHELEFGPALKGKVPDALFQEFVQYVEEFIGVIDFSLQRKKILEFR